jgi:hypothetical protein
VPSDHRQVPSATRPTTQFAVIDFDEFAPSCRDCRVLEPVDHGLWGSGRTSVATTVGHHRSWSWPAFDRSSREPLHQGRGQVDRARTRARCADTGRASPARLRKPGTRHCRRRRRRPTARSVFAREHAGVHFAESAQADRSVSPAITSGYPPAGTLRCTCRYVRFRPSSGGVIIEWLFVGSKGCGFAGYRARGVIGTVDRSASLLHLCRDRRPSVRPPWWFGRRRRRVSSCASAWIRLRLLQHAQCEALLENLCGSCRTIPMVDALTSCERSATM